MAMTADFIDTVITKQYMTVEINASRRARTWGVPFI